jgi:hypothetical protein
MKKLMLAVLLAAPALQAQKPAQAVVNQVNDRRNAGSTFSQLTIGMELPAVQASTVAASRVLVRTATDDSGADLVARDAEEPMLYPNMRQEGAISVSMTLKNPARTATKLREASGEIELYMPSKDPNSTADVPKFLPASGKALAHKALKANGIEITFLTAAQLDAENRKREEYARLQLEESELAVRIKDPQNRIHELGYVDAKGELQRVSTRDDEGLTIIATWNGKPQPDWKLRVQMKTAKSVVRMPFALTDIALP